MLWVLVDCSEGNVLIEQVREARNIYMWGFTIHTPNHALMINVLNINNVRYIVIYFLKLNIKLYNMFRPSSPHLNIVQSQKISRRELKRVVVIF